MKKRVLIIGNSKTIKKLMFLIFNKYFKIYNSSFRKSWNYQKFGKFEIIILTGFHFDICYMNKKQLNKYIEDYKKFLLKLKKYCHKLILISTFLNIRYSYCRVVFFYYSLLKDKKILNKKNIEIYHFRKIIISKNFLDKYLNKVFLLFNFEIIENVAYNFSKYKMKKLNKIKFYHIYLPRSRFIDRILRIF